MWGSVFGALVRMTRSEHPVDALALSELAVARAITTLEGTPELGRPFRCVVPGHDGMATVERRNGGLFVYRDCTGGAETLAAVRATLAYAPLGLVDPGSVSAPRKWESQYWYRRLFWEAGVIEPVDVAMPEVPARARELVKTAAREFRLLVGLRWITHPGNPTLFGRKFAAACSGLSEDAARQAITDLVRLGIIRRLPEQSGNAYLYLPAERPATS